MVFQRQPVVAGPVAHAEKAVQARLDGAESGRIGIDEVCLGPELAWKQQECRPAIGSGSAHAQAVRTKIRAIAVHFW